MFLHLLMYLYSWLLILFLRFTPCLALPMRVLPLYITGSKKTPKFILPSRTLSPCCIRPPVPHRTACIRSPREKSHTPCASPSQRTNRAPEEADSIEREVPYIFAIQRRPIGSGQQLFPGYHLLPGRTFRKWIF